MVAISFTFFFTHLSFCNCTHLFLYSRLKASRSNTPPRRFSVSIEPASINGEPLMDSDVRPARWDWCWVMWSAAKRVWQSNTTIGGRRGSDEAAGDTVTCPDPAWNTTVGTGTPGPQTRGHWQLTCSSDGGMVVSSAGRVLFLSAVSHSMVYQHPHWFSLMGSLTSFQSPLAHFSQHEVCVFLVCCCTSLTVRIILCSHHCSCCWLLLHFIQYIVCIVTILYRNTYLYCMYTKRGKHI